MQQVSVTTRFANRTIWQAVLILTILLVATVGCLWAALSPKPTSGLPEADGSDLRVYRRIIERVHAGEDYYDAAGSELRAGGYPTGAMFNWRTPTYAWVLGMLPALVWGQIALVMLALLTTCLAFVTLLRQVGLFMALAATILLWGAFHWCVDGEAYLSQELWSGILLGLSVAAYAIDRRRLGTAAGLGALFFRELALPYVVLTLTLACWQRRRKEAAVLFGGLMLYGLLLLFHGVQVSRHVLPTDRLPGSWIQFGGLAFLLQTCRMNAFLFSAPAWVSALYLPLSLLGLAGWKGETGLRLSLTAVVYIAAFAVVGQPFNDYWGLLYAPLLPFGLAGAPAALRDLLEQVSGVRRQRSERVNGQREF
jgi:hypothetical protein